jgi:hypothetical protein
MSYNHVAPPRGQQAPYAALLPYKFAEIQLAAEQQAHGETKADLSKVNEKIKKTRQVIENIKLGKAVEYGLADEMKPHQHSHADLEIALNEQVASLTFELKHEREAHAETSAKLHESKAREDELTTKYQDLKALYEWLQAR